jgi:hypothetical protein
MVIMRADQCRAIDKVGRTASDLMGSLDGVTGRTIRRQGELSQSIEPFLLATINLLVNVMFLSQMHHYRIISF